ncbi:MAG: hypothetical protein RMY90_10730, partial [Planktomarina sp.]|nr:hypothetical protein [Planktomarina sp.]
MDTENEEAAAEEDEEDDEDEAAAEGAAAEEAAAGEAAAEGAAVDNEEAAAGEAAVEEDEEAEGDDFAPVAFTLPKRKHIGLLKSKAKKTATKKERHLELVLPKPYDGSLETDEDIVDALDDRVEQGCGLRDDG